MFFLTPCWIRCMVYSFMTRKNVAVRVRDGKHLLLFCAYAIIIPTTASVCDTRTRRVFAYTPYQLTPFSTAVGGVFATTFSPSSSSTTALYLRQGRITIRNRAVVDGRTITWVPDATCYISDIYSKFASIPLTAVARVTSLHRNRWEWVNFGFWSILPIFRIVA